MTKQNFIECINLEEANKVSLEDYVFMENLSATWKKYVFKIRQMRMKSTDTKELIVT